MGMSANCGEPRLGDLDAVGNDEHRIDIDALSGFEGVRRRVCFVGPNRAACTHRTGYVLKVVSRIATTNSASLRNKTKAPPERGICWRRISLLLPAREAESGDGDAQED
jgi:hypothetical protein